MAGNVRQPPKPMEGKLGATGGTESSPLAREQGAPRAHLHLPRQGWVRETAQPQRSQKCPSQSMELPSQLLWPRPVQ